MRLNSDGEIPTSPYWDTASIFVSPRMSTKQVLDELQANVKKFHPF